MRYPFQSLRFRWLATSVIIVVLFFAATLWNTLRVLREVSEDTMRVSIRQTSETLNLAVVPYTTANNLPLIADYFNELVNGHDTRLLYVALLDEGGRVLVKTPTTPNAWPDADRPMAEQIRDGAVHVSQPILVFDNQVGHLRYGLSTASANEARKRLVMENSVALSLALLASVGLIAYVGMRLNRRITGLVSVTGRLASGELSARADLRGQDELAYLGQVFNQMAQSMQDRVADLETSRAEISVLNHDLERRVAERTVDLQEVVAGLETFNRSVSHDLRGPLGGIAGLAQLADQALANGDDSVARRVLPVIANQALLSTRMVAGLLELARVSDEPLTYTKVDLHALIQDVMEQLAMAKPSQPMPQITIGSMPPLRAAPALLHATMTNLLSNAVKFTRDAAEPRIDIQARLSGDAVTVCVKDNGPGFDATAGQHLFEPFVRLHASQFEGHGVGLSIVRRAVTRQGGRVWAESTPGQGASFCFTLPQTHFEEAAA